MGEPKMLELLAEPCRWTLGIAWRKGSEAIEISLQVPVFALSIYLTT